MLPRRGRGGSSCCCSEPPAPPPPGEVPASEIAAAATALATAASNSGPWLMLYDPWRLPSGDAPTDVRRSPWRGLSTCAPVQVGSRTLYLNPAHSDHTMLDHLVSRIPRHTGAHR